MIPAVREICIGFAENLKHKNLDYSKWHNWLIKWGISCALFALTLISLVPVKLSVVRNWLTDKFMKRDFPSLLIILLLTFAASVFLRLLSVYLGRSFDAESWFIVGKAAREHLNIYRETSRYNYGPVYSWFLGFIYFINENFSFQYNDFRRMVALFLSLVDIGIGIILWKRFRNLNALFLFLLNPLSILCSGYFNQFDNLAILFGISGVLLYFQNEEQNTLFQIAGVLLFSLSLATKHILFLFPVWVVLNARLTNRQKIEMGLVPVILFALSFVPYLANGGLPGILNNVLGYRSIPQYPLLGWLLEPAELGFFSMYIFLGLLLSLGFITRNQNIILQFLIYLSGVVAFSSGMLPNYYVIPMIAVILLGGRLKYFYILWVTLTAVIQDMMFKGFTEFMSNSVLNFILNISDEVAVFTLVIILVRTLLKIHHQPQNSLSLVEYINWIDQPGLNGK
ncbi:MAG: hypothetical protein GC181_02855 [Bacteroidetes bacterium]|nr:hypothetical protein [Bacteroidota bacterium]